MEFHQLIYFLAAAQMQNFRKAEEEFIFALVYRRVGSISRAAREFISTIAQQTMKTLQP